MQPSTIEVAWHPRSGLHPLFVLLVSSLSSIGVLLPLFPSDVMAQAIPPTGQCAPNPSCVDPNYTLVPPTIFPTANPTATPIASPQPLSFAEGGPPFGNPSNANFVAPNALANFCAGEPSGHVGQPPGMSCGPFDIQVAFNVPAAQPTGITITGTLSAVGPVAAAVGQTAGSGNGVGGYLNNGAPFPSTLNPAPFSISVPVVAGTNYLDFIGSGCFSGPGACNPANEPASIWLADPMWTSASFGTSLDVTPEAVLFATGGAPPGGPVVPEPSSLFLLGTGLVGIARGLLGRKRLS